jgi:hypothetical protein
VHELGVLCAVVSVCPDGDSSMKNKKNERKRQGNKIVRKPL